MLGTTFSLAILLHFAALVQAYESFQTICSTPTTTVNYVSSADTRGTLDIIWSCLFTIIVCAWTAQHLNVPEQREGRDPGWRGDIKWAMKRTWTSAKWMLATIIAPELVYAKNYVDWEYVKSIDVGGNLYHLTELQNFARMDGVPWTKAHYLFANMGGFVIRSFAAGRTGAISESGSQVVVNEPPGEITGISETPLQDATDIGTSRQEEKYEKSAVHLETGEGPENEPKFYYLIGPDILDLRRSGILPRLPYISKEELYDKSKNDSFVRFIAVFQILWMAVQMTSRAFRHLAISQLEVATIAFAASAISIYLVNWKKPKGVQVPYTLLCYPGALPFSISEKLIWRLKWPYERSLKEELLSKLRLRDTHLSTSLTAPIPNDRNLETNYLGKLCLFNGLTMGCFIYGSIHMAAWNFAFPTEAERYIWRFTSVFCMLFLGWLMVCLSQVILFCHYFCIPERFHDIPLKITTVLVSLCYILGRLFLVVECFRSLLFMPPSGFVATWAVNIPHV